MLLLKDKINKLNPKNKCLTLFTQMSFQVNYKYGGLRLFKKKLYEKTFKRLLFPSATKVNDVVNGFCL